MRRKAGAPKRRFWTSMPSVNPAGGYCHQCLSIYRLPFGWNPRCCGGCSGSHDTIRAGHYSHCQRLRSLPGELLYSQGPAGEVRAAVAALIFLAAYRIGKATLKNVFSWVLAAGAFLLALLSDINVVYVILAGALMGIAPGSGRGCRPVILVRLLTSFFRLGLFTIVCGATPCCPLIQKEVQRSGWMTAEEFIDMIAIAEMTPGPVGVNTATFVGFRQAGFLGGEGSGHHRHSAAVLDFGYRGI